MKTFVSGIRELTLQFGNNCSDGSELAGGFGKRRLAVERAQFKTETSLVNDIYIANDICLSMNLLLIVRFYHFSPEAQYVLTQFW